MIILSFIIPYVITFVGAFCFFMWIWITLWCHLLSTWQSSFSVSCEAGQLAMNFPVFVYLRMSLFHLRFQNSLLNIRFSVDSFLSTLRMCDPIVFCPPFFLIRSQLLILFESGCSGWVIFLLLTSRVSFCLCLSEF